MCYSLPMGYRSPDAIQPLLASGRLMDRAGRRLNETAKFVLQTCMPGGLPRYSEGFATTIRVRLMHAQMRRLLLQQGTWDSQSWGTPINQADMIGTNMLFTWIPLEGLRALGFRISAEEANDYVQLWRYSGHLSGIEPELLCATEEENRRMSDLIDTTMRRPNEDSYALTEALMDSIVSRASNPREEELARRLKPFLYGASRYFIGDERADSLRYPESSWGLALAGIRGAVASMERVRTNIPGAKRLAVRLGTKAWEQLVESGLDGIPATFGLPTELSRIVGLGRKPS